MTSDRSHLIDGAGATALTAREPVASAPSSPWWRRPGIEIAMGVMVVAVVTRLLVGDLLGGPLLQTWTTRMVAVLVQALPFLVLGVVVSGAIAALLPAAWLARLVPARTAVAVPVASLAGSALPGCECSAVPIAGRLVERGMPASAALAFMLAAPAINPVVLVATAVAFPDQPRMVIARYLASLATAMTVGMLWARNGPRLDDQPVAVPPGHHGHTAAGGQAGRWAEFSAVARHDLAHAGGWLVVGAAVAATFQTVLPTDVLLAVARNELFAVLGLSVLALVLAVCSEADAFVAAGLQMFPSTALLVFLVVGPAVDVKLIALQVGVFGRRFAVRFAPLTLAVAVVVATAVGRVLL